MLADIESFDRSLAAIGRSVRTRQSYCEGLAQFAEWADDPETEDINRALVDDFVINLRELGRADGTIAARYAALRAFLKWAAEEEIIDRSPLLGATPPVIREKQVEVLTAEQVNALLIDCRGKDFVHRRDTAIVSMFYDTGARRAELLNMTVDNVDTRDMTIAVTGKGSRPRTLAYGNATSVDLDRYLRVRAKHPRASTGWLWLGPNGRFSESGLVWMLNTRGERAGIGRVHPHQFRHSFAHAWLAQGGQEQDLMRLAGWRSRTMLNRYGASAASERARNAHRIYSPRDQL